MGVTNGQPVDQAFTNPAFLDRRLDDTAFGKYTLNNTTDPNSGNTVIGLQEHINNFIQNSKLLLYSLTHQKISYASGVLTFPENLVIDSPDYAVLNNVNIPSPMVNISDGQSMFCTLNRYTTGTIGYTVSNIVPKTKDLFRICTRVGSGVIFWPNTLIMDGNSVRLGEGLSTGVSDVFETPVGAINGVNNTFTLTYSPFALFLFLGGTELRLGKDYTISSNTLTMITIPAIDQDFDAHYFRTLSGGGGTVTGAANEGTGVGIFDSNVGGILNLRSIVGVSGITATQVGPEVHLSATASGQYVPFGSESSPSVITAAGGVTPSADLLQTRYIKGVTSSGAVTVTANPQIAAGTTVGQRVTLTNVNASDYVILNDLNGLSLNGSWPSALNPLYAKLEVEWTGLRWNECSRK